MDNKGFISLEYVFSLFIIIIIACGMLFYSESTLNSSFNIEESITHRLILDDVAGKITQVNSNGAGYSKYIVLPYENGYFEITVEKSKLTIEYDGKKGETPLPFVNTDKRYKLISGRGYCIAKDDEGKIVIT